MNKSDQIIWYVMITAISIIIIGGGAWANSINDKIEKIAGLEVNIQFIKDDIKSIKYLIEKAINSKTKGE